ncbi:fluoride efflux transporter CrcB [Tepidibacillus infernus]|uniref:fluoride efflux transporter CrcB n=1 Tax=Tepidibacillus TaxID=1494427 RepID=UPI0015EBAFDC|nr:MULTISPECIES: fluoride efflux transporter CrcB [Tepidibacillus]
MLNGIYVAIGGFFGAITRYSMGRWISKRVQSSFPFGTFIINLLGSFLLGLLFGTRLVGPTALLLGTGFMGAFTTFSTFKVESIKLSTSKEWRTMILYVGLSYTLGVLLAFVGYLIGLSL